MAGWTSPDRDLTIWDGTIQAKNFSFNGQSLDDRYVNVAGDTMTGDLNIVSSTAAGTLRLQGDDGTNYSFVALYSSDATPKIWFQIHTKSPTDHLYKIAYWNGSSFVEAFTLDDAGISYQNHAESRPSRALETIYQNTTGHPILVYGSVKVAYDDLGDNVCYVSILTGSSSPPGTLVQRLGAVANINFVGVLVDYWEISHPFSFVVQPNHYYKLTATVTGSAFATLDVWNEVNF